VQLALAADEDFARKPVDVVELNRNDLGSAKPEPRHEQQHRVVAPPDGGVRSDRFDDPPDFLGAEIVWQIVKIGLGDSRQAVGKIAAGLAAPMKTEHLSPRPLTENGGRGERSRGGGW
jgi:hypothetical protein